MIALVNNLSGTINLPKSKSYLHRYLLLGLLNQNKIKIKMNESDYEILDVQDTVNVLKACNVKIKREDLKEKKAKQQSTYYYFDYTNIKYNGSAIKCYESGTTLRISLLIMLLLFGQVKYYCHESLLKRPLTFYENLFKYLNQNYQGNFQLKKNMKKNEIIAKGNLRVLKEIKNLNFDFIESSQYISSLMMIVPFLKIKEFNISFTKSLESIGYLKITQIVLNQFNINIDFIYKDNLKDNISLQKIKYIETKKEENNPEYKVISIPSDASSAAFWKVSNYFGNKIKFNADFAYQPDNKLDNILNSRSSIIDFAQIPDLFPILCIYAVLEDREIKFINYQRNKIKESDRVKAMLTQLNNLGFKIIENISNNEIIFSKIKSSVKNNRPEIFLINGYNDHRIIMSFVILFNSLGWQVKISDENAVAKSYPNFWEDYKNLKKEQK